MPRSVHRGILERLEHPPSIPLSALCHHHDVCVHVAPCLDRDNLAYLSPPYIPPYIPASMSQIDPRMVQLTLIIKLWAKRRGINSAFKGGSGDIGVISLREWCKYVRIFSVVPLTPHLHLANTQTHTSQAR